MTTTPGTKCNDSVWRIRCPAASCKRTALSLPYTLVLTPVKKLPLQHGSSLESQITSHQLPLKMGVGCDYAATGWYHQAGTNGFYSCNSLAV